MVSFQRNMKILQRYTLIFPYNPGIVGMSEYFSIIDISEVFKVELQSFNKSYSYFYLLGISEYAEQIKIAQASNIKVELPN